MATIPDWDNFSELEERVMEFLSNRVEVSSFKVLGDIKMRGEVVKFQQIDDKVIITLPRKRRPKIRLIRE